MAKPKSTKTAAIIAQPKTGEIAVPTRQELELIPPAERWTAEEKLDEVAEMIREINDEELRHWVEVEGKTQREISEIVGRPRSTIARRASELGLQSHSPRGRKKKQAEIVQANNSGPIYCPTCKRMVADIKGVWRDDEELKPGATECPTCGWPVEPPPKPLGVREKKKQSRIFGAVLNHIEPMRWAFGELDPSALGELVADDRQARARLSQLEDARSWLSWLINHLRDLKVYQQIKASDVEVGDVVFVDGSLYLVDEVLESAPEGEEEQPGCIWLVSGDKGQYALPVPVDDVLTVERLGGEDNA